jgi:hypothetical protein
MLRRRWLWLGLLSCLAAGALVVVLSQYAYPKVSGGWTLVAGGCMDLLMMRDVGRRGTLAHTTACYA